jgi:hypothetical protein
MSKPPIVDVSFENLPTDYLDRHEILVDVFGRYLLWARDESLGRMKKLVESDAERDSLGRLFREVYEEVAKLTPEDRERAYRLAEHTVSAFARMFLTMISGEGYDDPLGSRHVFRYRLQMEVCDAESGKVVFEETINRGGKRFFPDYFGRWMNRFAVSGLLKGDE